MTRKILITGGAGFIGSSLAERLARDPDNFIVIVDNLLTGSHSKDVSAKIAPLIRKGKNVTTGVMLLGNTWRLMICQLLTPKARAERT